MDTGSQIRRRLDYQPPAYTISHVSLVFYLHPHRTIVQSRLEVSRKGEQQAPLILDGEGLNLTSLCIDGQPVTEYREEAGRLIIDSFPAQAVLSIETVIDPFSNKALEGLYLSNGTFCTQCEAEGFRRITYFLDRPDVLSTYDVTLHAPRDQYPFLLSNGNRVAEGEGSDGSHWVKWQDPFPKPCYLFALVAGDFDVRKESFVTLSGRQVALEVYVEKGYFERSAFALHCLKKAMAWDEQQYQLEYDLDTYMIVAVDFFNMGAMENKGLNVFNSKYVLADASTATDEDFFNIDSIIAHEYFHNWTGNRVTCRDWFQLSLKEGLTVFRDQQYSADQGSSLATRIKQVRVMREHQFAEDAGSMSHPIRPDEVMEMNNFYTVTVYDKGAEVIRMLHTLLGDTQFKAGIAAYFKRFDGQAVTCDDFLDAMQSVTAVDLEQFRRWYAQSGTPVVSVVLPPQHEGRVIVQLSQTTAPTADQQQKDVLDIPIGIELISADGRVYRHIENGIRAGLVRLQTAQAHVVFEGVQGDDFVPSVLANFTAPVRVNLSLNVEQRLRIFRYATDAFSRWDALQEIYRWCINTFYTGNNDIPDVFWQALDEVIQTHATDMEFLAECLAVPSVETLLQEWQDADVIALGEARKAFCGELCARLSDSLLHLYARLPTPPYAYDQKQVNMRRLRAQVLYCLSVNTQHQTLITSLFANADNMTDTLSALKAAQNMSNALFDSLMAKFEARWRHEPLVMDKWFALHASCERPDALLHIDALRQHPAFTADNPNRIRALIGSFAFYNTAGFHARDGSGYRYLTDFLLTIDKVNPQVSARLVTPLTQWQRLHKQHRVLMVEQLQRLLASQHLSKDLFEKVSKSLAFANAYETAAL